MNANQILFRHQKKFQIPAGEGSLTLGQVAAFVSNLDQLGYVPSASMVTAFSRLSVSQSRSVHDEILSILKEARGVRKYEPMYPNFPQQVMDMDEGELYLNAYVHYLTVYLHDVTRNTFPVWTPKYSKNPRLPLREQIQMTTVELGSDQDLDDICTQIITSNTSISDTDRQELEWFVQNGSIVLDQPIPFKENLVIIANLLVQYNRTVELASLFRTATDVLRLAAALSGGDVSLAKPVKFKSFSRKMRRVLLGLLEPHKNLIEDMARWKSRWVRLGERLHPNEFSKQFPNTANAFSEIRNVSSLNTFNSRVEGQLASKNIPDLIWNLQHRPGDFTRRLDHTLRVASTEPIQSLVVDAWSKGADQVSTPVLLQAFEHFQHRDSVQNLRAFLPKGNVARVQCVADTRATLPIPVCNKIIEVCEKTLFDRFSKLDPLGKVFVDPELYHYTIPASQRSASESMRQLTRGSRASLNHDKDWVRFFIWWTDIGYNRVDLDLSAVLLDENWNWLERIAYTNLKSGRYQCCHSGDITSAPSGASEFIDIHIPSVAKHGRYVAMMVNSFTGQPFNTIPGTCAGWMSRDNDKRGEIYDPLTVEDRFAVTSSSRMAMPLIIDTYAGKVIWCDLTLKGNGIYNVESNSKQIVDMARAFAERPLPKLGTLFKLHARARGELVYDPANADVVFSTHSGITPDQISLICSKYLL